jgi:hypothetical protein
LIEYGTFGTATYSTSLSGIDEMMTVLQDNVNNEISARDVRDVVLTLYDEIQSATSSEFFYSNQNTITEYIGNWRIPNSRGWGGTFSSVSLQELFDNIFYKDSNPSAGIKIVPTIQTTLDFKQQGSPEYRSFINPSLDNSGFDEVVGAFSFDLTMTAKTYDLDPNGVINRTPAPTNVPDGKNGNPLFNVSVPARGGTTTVGTTKLRINQTNTYTFFFEDIKGNDASAPVTINYGNRSYIGVVSSRSIPTDAEIRQLSRSASLGVPNNSGFNGSGYVGQPTSGGFVTLKGKEIKGHGGGSTYLIIATPEDLSFTILEAPAFFYEKFTKEYKNEFGYVTTYNIYISYEPYIDSVTNYKII